MKKCKKCKVPLEGPLHTIAKGLFKVMPSQHDAQLCNKCEPKESSGKYQCQICKRYIDESAALTHVKAEEYLLELIRKDHPQWKEKHNTCERCITYYRELIKKAEI